jgi:hypothetical protein
MAVVGGEREIPPRGNLLRSGKTGTQQMAGAGTLYPEQTVHLRAFVVTLVRPAWATTRWWKTTTPSAVESVSRRQGCPSWGGIWRKSEVSEKMQAGKRLNRWTETHSRPWKQWKKSKTKVGNLRQMGVLADRVYQWGNSRLGYWRIAGSPVLKGSITNARLAAAGYFSILRYYESLHLCGWTDMYRPVRTVVWEVGFPVKRDSYSICFVEEL